MYKVDVTFIVDKPIDIKDIVLALGLEKTLEGWNGTVYRRVTHMTLNEVPEVTLVNDRWIHEDVE